MSTLFILRGLPGSGKSTLAKQLCSMHTKAISISLDDFIALEGFQKDKMKGWAEFNYERFMVAITRRIPVIVYHNVNAMGWQWRDYKDHAEKNGYQVFVLIVENTHGGKSTKEIPENQMTKLRNQFNVHL